MFGHFRLFPFLGGIILASLIFLVWNPKKEIIHEYPHPNDGEGKVFRDPNKTCYKYSVHEVDCDINEATLKDYPIQG